MADLMRVLQERDDEPKRPTRPVMEAQRHELSRRWTAYHAEHPAFEGGKIVRFKHGLGSFKAESRADHALIFWRYLDLSAWLDQQIIEEEIPDTPIRSNFDCLIAAMSDGGEGLSFMLADSREFERDPEDAA